MLERAVISEVLFEEQERARVTLNSLATRSCARTFGAT